MSPWISPHDIQSAMTTGRGRGVRVAVLDTGIEIRHPQFEGRQLCHDFVVELSQPWGDGGGTDIYGHGTAIAGLIWKLAPEAEIGSFRVLGPNLAARSALVALAAECAIHLGYHILNCSFSCALPGHLSLYKEWTDKAFLSGVNVVAAGGSGEGSLPEWPSHLTSVMGVGCGVTPGCALTKNPGSMVEFLASGSEEEVAWAGGGVKRMTGSSFAAARVSGMLACVLELFPQADPLLLKVLLRQIAGQ